MPNRLTHFWFEIKRRNVHRLMAIYAGTAYIVFEASTLIFPRWGLPDWTIDLILYLLILGAIVTFIVSWIYDITPEGVQKTKPISELEEGEVTRTPNAWKIATFISFMVIAGLIVLNITSRSNLTKPGRIHSVAVLPFNNYTGDDKLDYVADGMLASLITDIGKVSALRVTGETSSKTYKNTDKSAPVIGEELNVDLLIEPTLTCYGDSVCVLIRGVTTTKNEKQILVKEYRVDREEILSFYPRVVKEISQELKLELSPEETRLLSKSRRVDQEAYDEYLKAYNEYLKARSYVNEFSKESLFQAIKYLNSAIEKEPDWAPLYARLAEIWIWVNQVGYEPPSVAGPKIFENMNRARELDPDLPEIHYLSAVNAQWLEWNWEKSEKAFLKALALNPSDSYIRLFYAQLLLILQRNNEARAQIELAEGLDPFSDEMKLLYSGTMVLAGDFEAALPAAEEALAKNPTSLNANHMVSVAAYHLGEHDKVIRAMPYTLPFSIEEDVYEGIVRIYNESGIAAAYGELINHMEQYAENNHISYFDMAGIYMMANRPEKVMDCIEKAFEMHDPQLGYIVTPGGYSKLLGENPRFIAICEKMNLPLPLVN